MFGIWGIGQPFADVMQRKNFLFCGPSLETRRETVESDALPVKIVKAELGAAAGLIGAGLNAFEALGAR